MFDLGWSEMMLIGIVALIVVGPKELPGLFRSIGLAMGKARGMAREFTRAMEAAADETGMKEIDRTIRAATRPMQLGADRLRDAAGISRSAGKPGTGVMTAGTPLTAGKAASAGPATAALAQRRADEQAALRLTNPVAAAPADPMPVTPPTTAPPSPMPETQP